MISIKKLQELADAVYTTGPAPTVRVSQECIGNSTAWAHAHNHAKKYSMKKGLICFSWSGFNRSNKGILLTLAHELAHLRCPQRAHRSKKFQAALRDIYLDVLREVIIRQNRGDW